jgi:16S rRNA U1498 N3-methylase RsmE
MAVAMYALAPPRDILLIATRHLNASPCNYLGVMRLRRGDQLSVFVESNGDADYGVQHESGFFVALLHAE